MQHGCFRAEPRLSVVPVCFRYEQIMGPVCIFFLNGLLSCNRLPLSEVLQGACALPRSNI
jgi:hypothetical protein